MKLFASFMLLVVLSITNASAATTTNPDPTCALLVYRDVFQNLLTDWPEAGGRPRSPRFIFGKVDPITVEVRLKIQQPSPVLVEVINTTSLEQHDVDCDYVNYSNGWYVYRLRSTEFIYLIGSPPANPTGTTFGMVNEEVLHFTVKGSSPTCTQNWMVDRGERSSGGAVFYGGATGDQGVVRFQQWYENGDRNFTDASGIIPQADLAAAAAFINNAGSNPASGEQGDLLHWSSHGAYTGALYDNLNCFFYPLGNGQSWSTDLEYAVLAACNTLTNFAAWESARAYPKNAIVTKNTGYYECVTAGISANPGPSGTGGNIVDGTVVWRSISAPPTSNSDPFSGFIAWLTMTTGSHNAHAIFGAKHPLSGDLRTQMTSFYGNVTAGKTYFESYVIGMESGTKQPWSVLIDPVYQADKFKEVQQDGYQGHRVIESN